MRAHLRESSTYTLSNTSYLITMLHVALIKTYLDDDATLKHDDYVSAFDSTQPVGDHQHRSAPRGILNRLLDDPLALVVQRA